MSKLSLVFLLIAATASAATDPLFIDGNRETLIKAVPELASMEFDSNQSLLTPLLEATGKNMYSMFEQLVNVSMAEDVHEMRFDSAHIVWKDHRDQFRYVIQTRPFDESRKPEVTRGPFLITGRFAALLSDLLPDNQSQARFRYLGQVSQGGAKAVVIAFVQNDSSRQGLVWIDAASKRIVRLRTDLLKPEDGSNFDSVSRDIRFVAVKFPSSEAASWLPASVTVHVRFPGGEMHTVHRFSDYRVDDADKESGQASGPTAWGDDAFERLQQGVTLLEESKAAEAMTPLQDAAGLLPDRSEPAHYLAVAHNQVGVGLFQHGDKAGALKELQEAVRLDPTNTKLQANLKTVSGPTVPATGDVTIKVDVRQVLVPAVVTDKEGHHISGLKQSDFQVFEDGVEQKITAFGSERADMPSPHGPAADAGNAGSPSGSAPPQPLAKRHAYVIVLDTTHAAFENFVAVRQSLQKLFQEEQPGDSQYAVLGLGRSMEIIQNTTSDPAKVLETLSAPPFQKRFQSTKSSAQFEVRQFEHELQEVRSLCDAHDPSCPLRKQVLPSAANQLAEHERVNITQFLSDFRSIVEQLSKGSGRKTLILISDGFLLAPGEVSYGLLQAYFSEFRSTQSIERMQDMMEPIYKLAAKGNVTIYTIDSRRLYTSPSFDASRGGTSASVGPEVDRTLNDIATDEGAMLSEIAAATGGTAFQNSNDLLSGLKRAFADGREYYTLAYVSSNEIQDGKFRKIEVKLRDSKALVSAKRGYWATAQ